MGEASSIRAVREREVVVDWGIDGVDGRSLVLIVFVNLDEAVLVEGQWNDIVVGRRSMGYWCGLGRRIGGLAALEVVVEVQLRWEM